MLVSAESAEDLLAYRKADLIFTVSPVNNRSVVCSHFTSIPTVMICREAHPRLGAEVSVEELYQEKFTMYQSTNIGVKERQAEINDAFPERNIAFRSDSLSSLLSMIAISDLVGYIPVSIFETYKDGLKLRSVTPPFKLPEVEIYMVYNRASLNSSVFANFIEKMHKLAQ